ncbi:aminoglycoside phosphotransferase family protein [unidentified bacterial endosymbiont]|uniref:aminoglycoside phosphotransferase family protein n=1 Tax=unidentified bacterial endosymbiont TaxID=2355 RepID=UPI003F5126F1
MQFELWLSRWKLIPDGSPFVTHTSQRLPVKTSIDGIKAMLKITGDQKEKRGNALMAWWAGNGAAQIISHESAAMLLERATGPACQFRFHIVIIHLKFD